MSLENTQPNTASPLLVARPQLCPWSAYDLVLVTLYLDKESVYNR